MRLTSNTDAIDSLNATVTFTATEGGTLKGKETTYTSFQWIHPLRKPESLRVIGFLAGGCTRGPLTWAATARLFSLWIPP